MIRAGRTASARGEGASLVDWSEPERNIHVLDWRERAHAFGLVPVDRRGAIEPASVESPDQFLAEGEPEAFDDQPLDEAAQEALEPADIEEAPAARLPQEELDLVRLYLTHIGRRKLLTARQEQEIGRKMEVARGELLAEMAAIPAARRTLVSLAEAVRGHTAPAAELILLPDGGELKPEKIHPVLRAFARVRRLERQIERRRERVINGRSTAASRARARRESGSREPRRREQCPTPPPLRCSRHAKFVRARRPTAERHCTRDRDSFGKFSCPLPRIPRPRSTGGRLLRETPVNTAYSRFAPAERLLLTTGGDVRETKHRSHRRERCVRRSSMAPRKETELVPTRFFRDPFALMREMTSDVDRMFGEWPQPFFRWPRLRTRATSEVGWYPEIDVFEKENHLVTRIDLPGMKKDDVTVEVTDGHLTISGERKREAEEKGEEFYRCEREYGSFYRSVPLPEGAKIEEIKATFTDGVLEVSVPLPRLPETKARKVEIEEAKATKAAA
jgi:HSP20 family protein